jgi:hypothetical protein
MRKWDCCDIGATHYKHQIISRGNLRKDQPSGLTHPPLGTVTHHRIADPLTYDDPAAALSAAIRGTIQKQQ